MKLRGGEEKHRNGWSFTACREAKKMEIVTTKDAGLFGGAGGKEKGASEEVLELEENKNGESGNRTGNGRTDPVHERSNC